LFSCLAINYSVWPSTDTEPFCTNKEFDSDQESGCKRFAPVVHACDAVPSRHLKFPQTACVHHLFRSSPHRFSLTIKQLVTCTFNKGHKTGNQNGWVVGVPGTWIYHPNESQVLPLPGNSDHPFSLAINCPTHTNSLHTLSRSESNSLGVWEGLHRRSAHTRR
jgi:hypothetical protein